MTKDFKTFIAEGATYGIGDHVKLSYHASNLHGHEYGQISGIGGYGSLKGHVQVKLKKTPLHDGNYGPDVPIPMKELSNLSSDPRQHSIEIENHTYKNSGLRRGSKVKLKGGKIGKIEAHNQINGLTLLKHDDGSYSNHSPTSFAHLNKKNKT